MHNMELMQRDKQESPQGDFVTLYSLYKRWKQNAARIGHNKILKLKWIPFIEKTLGNLLLLEQYTGGSKRKWINKNTFKFNLIESRIPDQKPKRKRLIENKSVHYPKARTEINKNIEINKKNDSSEKKAERSNYFFLDSNLKNFLAGILNIRVPSVKIYVNQASDTLARQHNADAVTYKDSIFFKTGKYDPRDKKGIALLGHELTHVVQMKMQNLPERKKTGTTGYEHYIHEEKQAIDNEKRILSHFSYAEPYSENKNLLYHNSIYNSFNDYKFDYGAHRSFENTVRLDIPGNSTSDSKSNHIQTQAPRTAQSPRVLDLPPEINVGFNAGFQLSEQQQRMIRDDIYRDIRNKIKIEFERGG